MYLETKPGPAINLIDLITLIVLIKTQYPNHKSYSQNYCLPTAWTIVYHFGNVLLFQTLHITPSFT